MMDIEHLCPGCMRPRPDRTKPCPVCGYSEEKPAMKGALSAFSILAGRYLLGCPLGKGGFGITYLALDLSTEEVVAIKEYFPAELAVRDTDGETVLPLDEGKALYFRTGMRSFSEEGRLLSLFADVSGIVHYRGFIQENGTSYLVMNDVEGIPLRKYMKTLAQPFGEADALALMKPILLALAAMHEKGVLHRDVSPENLILGPDGHLTLIDFGAAREFSLDEDENLTVILKRGYAPEEQYHSGSRQGPWTDLYAACAVLYHMLTGELPQEAADRAENDQLRPLSRRTDLNISRRTCAALEKGLQVDPVERYADIPALMRDLYPQGNRPAKAAAAAGRESEPEKTETIASEQRGTERRFEPQRAADVPEREEEPYEARSGAGVSAKRLIAAAALALAMVGAVAVWSLVSKKEESGSGADASSFTALSGDSSTSEYDSDGNLLEYDEKERLVKITYSPPRYYSNYFSSYSAWLGWCTYEYDDGDRVTTETYYKKDGSVYARNEYEYDGEGNPTKLTGCDANGNQNGWSEWEYDADGQATGRTNYDADGNVTGLYVFEYDTDDITRKETFLNAEGSVSYIETFDADGNLTERIDYNADDDAASVIYEYGEDGRLTRGTGCDANGSTLYLLEYNSDSNPTKKTFYDDDGSVSGWREFAYDTDNYLDRYTNYDADGNVTDGYVYEYDADKNRTKKTHYDADGNVSSWYVYKNDADGNRTEKIKYDANGDKSQWVTYNYGEVPTKEYYDRDGLIYMNEYRYDIVGNGMIASYDADGNEYENSSDSD